MPECPELHLSSLFVNRMCEGVVFTGAVEKSEVSKCPEVSFCCDAYRIKAQSRGKEIRLTLTPIKSDNERKKKAGKDQTQEPMDVVFRFGMSGFFRFTTVEELPKHAHLRFYSNETPQRALSFVDTRRFGGWQPNGTWQANRGPCVMFDYESFRENVLSNLSDKAFNKPICEALLNQKYFNGIGNYLRAEILYRSQIAPFVKARTVLEGLVPKDEDKKKVKMTADKATAPDVLSMCHTVPLEVVKLGEKGYDPQTSKYSILLDWMQCYAVKGMNSLSDHNGRTIWFKGDPGPMAPKGKKAAQKRHGEHTDSKNPKKKSTNSAAKKPVQQKATKKIKKEIKPPRSQRGVKKQKNEDKKIKSEAAEENEKPNARKKSGKTAPQKTATNRNKAVPAQSKAKSAACRENTGKAKPQRSSSRAGLRSSK